MLKYKNYVLIKPNEDQKKQISKVIEDNMGSVFHEVVLNEIAASQFNTELFYFVNDTKEIKVLSPVHKKILGPLTTCYHFKPFFDIPYAGFVGKHQIDFNEISVGPFEAVKYAGFPYEVSLNEGRNGTIIGETNMINLSLSEAEIFDNVINSKKRNMIRKALKNGVEIKIYSTTEGLKIYWPLLKQLHDKLKIQPTNI